MGELRWTTSDFGSQVAWDGDDDVGQVHRVARDGEWVGWEASYWGHDHLVRSGPRLGHDPNDVGDGPFSSVELAKEAVEERHRGRSACEEGRWD